MSAAAAFPACPNVQESLELAFKANHLKLEPTPFVDFLLSDVNAGDIQRMQAPGLSKRKTVELTYQQRIAESDVSSTIDFTCTGGDEYGICTESYSIDPAVGSYIKRSVNPDDIATICEDGEMYWAKLIASMMDGCARQLETRAITGAQLLIGNYASNDTNGVVGTTKTVAFVDGSGDFSLDAYKELIFSAKQMGFTSAPIVFGSNETTKYFTEVAHGCCATTGIDIGSFVNANEMVYFDTLGRVDTNWAANNFFMMEAGAMQIIWYLRFQGYEPLNISSTTTNSRSVLVDPRRNMPFDVRVTENCGTLTVEVALANDIVGLPSDMYPTGDRLDGVTLVNKFTT